MEDERSPSFAVVELFGCPLSQIQVDFLYLQIPFAGRRAFLADEMILNSRIMVNKQRQRRDELEMT